MERRSGAAWLIGGMVLVPYATVLVPFEFGLRLQVALIIVVLAVAAWGGRQDLLERVRFLPSPIRLGLGLYAAAALWGAAVGIFAGNPTRFVASQAISMALFPAAAVAFSVRRDLDGNTLLLALGWAAMLALVLHGTALAVPQLGGEVPGHFGFDLRNGVGAGAVAPLIWLLGLAWVGAGSRRWSLAVPSAAAILCLWAQSRGAWVSALIGTLALLLLMAGQPGRAAALASGMALMPVALVIAAGVLVTRCEDRAGMSPSTVAGMPVRLESSAVTETVRETVASRPFEGAALQVGGRSSGGRGTSLWVWAEFVDAAGQSLGTRQAEIVGTGRWTRWASVLAAPPAARMFRGGLRLDPNQGVWLVDGFGLLVVRSEIEALGRQLCVRVSSLGGAIADPLADSALNYRMAESRAVHAVWSRTGLGRHVAGLGLGATFAFPNASLDSKGCRVVLSQASYIHDYYLFLLFKLGLAGAIALVGLTLIVAWTARSAFTLRGRHEGQWLLGGATTAWLAYLVWSVTSPEIYDFRMAPIWGALVAACCREVETGNAVANLGGSRAARNRPAAATRARRSARCETLRDRWHSALLAVRGASDTRAAVRHALRSWPRDSAPRVSDRVLLARLAARQALHHRRLVGIRQPR
ncbi:MAG: hypothetical protein ACHQQS_10225 [Thermoanaerobaculales bacterium]